MKIDLKELRNRAEYINEQKHPEFDLLLWNYNKRCQYENAWDPFTLMCRGLITDLEGNIVARPFKKFFNLNQNEETKLEALLQLGRPEISDKLDGSLGILYFHSGIPYISTRGSFSSDQAKWATEWIRRQPRFIFELNNAEFLDGYTYNFEVLYPGNRIVVDYGNRAECVLLAVINTDTGEELNYVNEANRLGLPYAPKNELGLNEIIERTKSLSGNEEGFVIKYSNGLKVKIKGEEYVRLHRLITGFSNKSIWELLMNHQPFDEFLERVPDEFNEYVKTTIAGLRHNYNSLYREAEEAFEIAVTAPTRKDQAEWILKNHKKNSGLIFGLLDKKDIEPEIWKMVRPKFAKPFRKDIDL